MRGETILIVDDERLIRWSLSRELSKAGFNVIEAETMKQGLSLLFEHDPDLVILDQILPDGAGVDILAEVKNRQSVIPVIMLTAVDKSDTAVQAMKLGAFDYLTKPVNIEELKIVVERALESTRLKRQVAHFLKQQERHSGFCGMMGTSLPMKKIFEDITKIAQSNGTTVLITGESGTGKELAAKAIHFLSDRREKPFLTVNCSALSETIIESELFGHERGAFTDAKVQKKGLFELADGGTVFLDEIGDVSPTIQIKLLRVLEEKAFQRLGGIMKITVDVRIIAVTNRPLDHYVAEKKFRSDLYYRLNVANVHLPPMRERGEDIVRIAEYFLQEFASTFHKQFKGINKETERLLLSYHWPGNVREIRNIIERAVLLHDDEFLQPHHVEFSHLHRQFVLASGNHHIFSDGISLDEMEKQALIQALEKTNYNQSQAAKLLQITRDTLRYRMKKFHLNTPS